MSDANVIYCPNCGQTYFVQPHQWAQYAGQTINCTRCGRGFAVATETIGPAPAAPTAAQVPPVQAQGSGPPPLPTAYSPFAAGMYPPPPARTSGWAISGLVLGILSFCLPALGSLAAIGTAICGLVATRPGRMAGRGLAVAGLVLGLFTLAIESPLVVMVYLPAARNGIEQTHRTQCADNMRTLGAALAAYAQAHNDTYPAQLDDLAEFSPAPPVTAFVCPSDSKSPPPAAPPDSMAAEINSGAHCSYIYVGTGVKLSADSHIVILYEPLGNHHRAGMNVLLADGQCRWLNADEAQTILDQRARGKRPIKVD